VEINCERVFNNIKSVYWVGLGQGVGRVFIPPIKQHPFNNFSKYDNLYYDTVLLHPVNVQKYWGANSICQYKVPIDNIFTLIAKNWYFYMV